MQTNTPQRNIWILIRRNVPSLQVLQKKKSHENLNLQACLDMLEGGARHGYSLYLQNCEWRKTKGLESHGSVPAAADQSMPPRPFQCKVCGSRWDPSTVLEEKRVESKSFNTEWLVVRRSRGPQCLSSHAPAGPQFSNFQQVLHCRSGRKVVLSFHVHYGNEQFKRAN